MRWCLHQLPDMIECLLNRWPDSKGGRPDKRTQTPGAQGSEHQGGDGTMRRLHWKDAFSRPDVRRLWKYGAAILVGGYVAKQLVWELAMSTIKEVNDKRHEEAAAHLEKAYEDGRRLAAMRRQQLLRQLEERDAASVSHHTRAK